MASTKPAAPNVVPGKPVIYGTGLSGMIGSRFTELYVGDYQFINLDLTTGVDITNPEQVNQALKSDTPSTVIHLAAFTDVSTASKQQGDKEGLVYKVNVDGTQNIASACKAYGHYLIHISTDFVFDGANPPAEGYSETDEPHPIEWYGETKYLAEKAVSSSGCQSVIVRTAFPFRSHFAGKLDLVRNILEKLQTNSLYPMFSDQIITPTFVDDLCSALNIFIAKKPQNIYHVAGSSFVSPYQLAQKIAEIFAIKADIKEGSFKDYMVKDPRPRQQYSKLSNHKLLKDFGYQMKTIDEALVILKDQLAAS